MCHLVTLSRTPMPTPGPVWRDNFPNQWICDIFSVELMSRKHNFHTTHKIKKSYDHLNSTSNQKRTDGIICKFEICSLSFHGTNVPRNKKFASIIIEPAKAGGVVVEMPVLMQLLSREQVELNLWLSVLDVPHLLASPMQDLCIAFEQVLHKYPYKTINHRKV